MKLPVILSLLMLTPGLASAATEPAKPNIIVILVDDMGWSDIGCYGGEIPTPNLDALAADGLRFTEFYNTGRCCPTRASLLTGLYPHQAGIGHMTADNHLPGYEGRLNDRCATMAEVLRPAGYFTAMAGKWHVGQNLGVVPWERGFERSLNAPAGGFFYGSHAKAQLFLNGKSIKNDDPRLPKDWYSTDLWTEFGIKFIDEALQEKKPFFLYLAHNAPHFPLQAPAEDIAKFRGKTYTKGWDLLRRERYERQLKMGLLVPKWELSPRIDGVKPWDSLTDKEKDRFDHIMAIYAACVWHMDKSVGDLVTALKQRGVYENTLILFMSDNGGNAETGPNGRIDGKNPGCPNSNVYCGESWANLQNTPNRMFKHYNHEGGISTPLVAHWPDGIKAKGEFRNQPGHVIDIMATVADFGGATYPKELHGKEIQPLEGRSLRPAFDNQALQRDAIFWEHEGNAAVRTGDWKLVRRGAKGKWELYDLKTDRTEMHNLAASQPERVADMTRQWNAWAKRANVLPSPAKGGGAKKKGKKAKATADSNE